MQNVFCRALTEPRTVLALIRIRIRHTNLARIRITPTAIRTATTLATITTVKNTIARTTIRHHLLA